MDSQGAQGLVTDTQTLLQETQEAPDAVRDAAIVSAQGKVEAVEIAGYKGLVTGAQQMGQNEIVSLLEENLRQEEQTARMIERQVVQLAVQYA